ncbi:fibrinogen-like protein 1-like protein [Amia ocellicauda]|uniref:fibrinogen-like protein 1-like protein n=1 Tax=Amia ocellicauda TaxID=2972642 RepID=UPI0034644328
MDAVRTLALAAVCLTALVSCVPSLSDLSFIENPQLLNSSHPQISNLKTQQGRSFPIDCSRLSVSNPSGVYVIQPIGSHPLVVYCEKTENKFWTVIQRNSLTTAMKWDESWTTYKNGFGSVDGDHWLGNENIHKLTSHNVYKVRFIIFDSHNNCKYADYNTFRVESETNGYIIRLGQHSGTAPNSMQTLSSSVLQDNMIFSTKDRDQDLTSVKCASGTGGFWYNACYNVSLNRKAYLYWGGLCTGNCKASVMMIMPSDICA